MTGKSNKTNNVPAEEEDDLATIQFKTAQVVDEVVSGKYEKNAGNVRREQLERTEQGLDTINADMKEAEEHLKGMEKCCGLCILPCFRVDDFEKNPEYANTWKKDDDGGVISDQPRITVGDSGAVGVSGGYITRITNDAREDEMDENIQQVSNMVGNLRNMAIDMGTEIANQNRQLDRIEQKALSNQDRISAANQRATKIISKV
ncbi:SNAP-25 family protein [Trichinella nativa]|uniref:Synaptosomal-associated protein n=1 Tax=Trichinella nativa TaxID=6335 RepID=A0A1Y3ETA4_9BILA|nr:SNAP-25 family protein [Trichinella nativa]